MITRAEVMRRAQTGWPTGAVPYSQNVIHQPDGYRCDCSGFVAMCWAIPLAGTWGGPNTVSLITDGWMREITPDELRPGDAVGLCGPGTAGDLGHVQLFDEWANNDSTDSHHFVWQQRGGVFGPRRELVDWTAGYRAYRYRDITDGGSNVTTLDEAFPSFDKKVMRTLVTDIREAASILLDGVTIGGDKPAGLYGVVREVVAAELNKRAPVMAVDATALAGAMLGDPRFVAALRTALSGLDLKITSSSA